MWSISTWCHKYYKYKLIHESHGDFPLKVYKTKIMEYFPKRARDKIERMLAQLFVVIIC